MKVIHNYNIATESVDLADQLQVSYHINTGVHNKKWWW